MHFKTLKEGKIYRSKDIQKIVNRRFLHLLLLPLYQTAYLKIGQCAHLRFGIKWVILWSLAIKIFLGSFWNENSKKLLAFPCSWIPFPQKKCWLVTHVLRQCDRSTRTWAWVKTVIAYIESAGCSWKRVGLYAIARLHFVMQWKTSETSIKQNAEGCRNGSAKNQRNYREVYMPQDKRLWHTTIMPLPTSLLIWGYT